VTRIIAGKAGSLTLAVPGAGTRPTSDRVRESLFGALESADLIQDSAVLDLYAGSGALALEAVSRGAASADLVELSPPAATIAERNARTVGKSVPGVRIRVRRAAVDAFLRSTNDAYDLVFIDPPYDIEDSDLAVVLALLVPRLKPAATIIVERAARSAAPAWPYGLVPTRDRRYGDTMLWWSEPV